MVEIVTSGSAALLIDYNISNWLHEKSAYLVRVAQSVATAGDWTEIDNVPRGKKSPTFDRYRAKLRVLWQQYFPHNEGDVYVATFRHGEEYSITPDDPNPMDDSGPINEWEAAAFATGKTTFNPVPYTDNSGTYLAAQTPIVRDGRIVGLAGAQYDSASLSILKELVVRTFWLSVLPGTLIALIVAYTLASMLVEPMEVFRQIEESAQKRLAAAEAPTTLAIEPIAEEGIPFAADPLAHLSPREREVAELVRRGLKNKEIADQLSVSAETVKKHLTKIREKTGLTRVSLAVQAEAARIVASRAAV